MDYIGSRMERLDIEQAGLHEAKTKFTKELELSMVTSAPTVKDWETANKDKRYISGFTDASVGKSLDGVSSAMGILIFLSNGDRPHQKRECYILSWRSSKNQLTTNPENTVFEAKRMIGHNWSDKAMQNDFKFYPSNRSRRLPSPMCKWILSCVKN